MTLEFKRKILDKWFDRNNSLNMVFNIPYYGIPISYHPTKKILVQWHGVYQVLTCSIMFSGALVKTYYNDQIDTLIKTINYFKLR